jgi:hypothetical protein
MKIVQASTKRVYEVEGKSIVRVLSSGIKLTDTVMRNMGLVAGDRIFYAEDEDDNMRIYLYKSDEGSIIGKNKAFTNTGLSSKLKAKANAINLEIKGGNHIVFDIDTTPSEYEGVSYFGLTFNEVKLGETSEEIEESATEESFE